MRPMMMITMPSVWLALALGCSSPTPCAELDQASCRQSKECRLAGGVDPCTQADEYVGCIDREAVCLGGASWYRLFEGHCVSYESYCAPEGLEECFPECLEDTADTGR